MKFIKDEIKKLNKDYVKFYNNFKITNILIILFTIYAVIFNFEDWFFVCYALLIMIPIVFYGEYSHKKIMYLIAGIVGVVSGLLMSGLPPMNIEYIYVGLILIFVVLDLYAIIKNEKNIPKYLCKLFESLLQVSIIFSILSFGLLILFLLSDYMIFNNSLNDYFYVIYYLCIGVYLVPSILLCLVYNDNKVTVLSDVLISKVLMVIMNIYFGIVLLYVLKGIITTNYSVYSVYIIIGCLFLLFLPLNIMAENYKGKYYEFNSQKLQYIFIIPLLLQIYVLVNQLVSYGFTTVRYIGLMFIIFEIFVLGLLFYKKKKYIVESLLVLASLLFIMFIVPGCNVRDVVLNSQYQILTELYPSNKSFDSISYTDKNRIKNIYEYIVDYDRDSIDEIPLYINKDKIEAYHGDINGDYSFSALQDKFTIDISEYKTLKYVDTNGTNYIVLEDGVFHDFSAFGEYAKYHSDEEFNKYVNRHALIHINKNTDFYLKEIGGTVNGSDYEFDYIVGYLLYK